MLAIMYDIHGNLPALQAVLSDAKLAGAHRWVFGGDYAFRGPRPFECVAQLTALRNATWIRGNTDRWLSEMSDDFPSDDDAEAALRYAVAELGASIVEDLDEYDQTAVTDGMLFCHGTPESDSIGFSPEPSDDDVELLGNVNSSVVVCGHTHIQFRRQVGGVEIVNPGSVGLPFDGDQRAAYALATGHDDIELRRVEYPVEQTIEQLRAIDEPWIDRVIEQLETARP